MKDARERWNAVVVPPTISILQAVTRMDEVRCKLLLVLERGHFLGLLSIGDVQRAIIRNVAFSEPIRKILRADIIVCRVGDSEDHVRSEMLRCRAVFMPILSGDGALIDVRFWEDYFSEQRLSAGRNALQLPVVIMAGGTGSRLRPLTNILPKPLLPFGGKTIIETIMDRFAQVGCTTFHVSLNYKAAMIRHYFAELKDSPYQISFFEESKPLGTAGSLSLVADRIKTPFFVSNCDIVIEQELDEVWNYHCANKNELTVIAALKHVKLAYGSLVTGQDGLLCELSEKPEWVFKVNSGVYILEPHLLSSVPHGVFFNMTDLIECVLARKGRVGVFPVSEGCWSDIGNWNDYQKWLRG